MAHDRAFRSNSFGISATIAFAFVMPNSRYLVYFIFIILLKLSISSKFTKPG
ncbi:hypothetical protein LEP1GSC021_4247 [Leptospira noguchii str. 1993005606]|uniref:Uncharacterized protein n=2 Tax=Leptospira noguchii TaxID=28182 RepID=M6Y9T6_9LEPT|nr:hypothetical protein [Leptospira noguchii]EMM99755.1 hypothetical protein LEP1GSC035_2867 [Leptospira noguchii str. 2007001578]EMO88621.1 hypothetical protein LEP1GSC024_0773 [Leptospira noguchii str. 2001034031]EPE85830.1 hypothetical protein LEP1GSC021_4247 [Leptospira noguchii str. 1993005606]